MTIRECYERIGEDYDALLARFGGSDAMAERFAKMFAGDQTFANLFASLEAKDAEQTFRAAHTLKGVSANVGFMQLQDAADQLTEALRGRDLASVDPALYEKVKEEYKKVQDALGELG